MITKNEQRLLLEMFYRNETKNDGIQVGRKVFSTQEMLKWGIYNNKHRLSFALKNLWDHDMILKRRVSQLLYPYNKRKRIVNHIIQENNEWEELQKRVRNDDFTEKEKELGLDKIFLGANAYTVPIETIRKQQNERAKELEMEKRKFIKQGLSKRHILVYLNSNGIDFARKLAQYEFHKTTEGKRFIEFIKSCT